MEVDYCLSISKIGSVFEKVLKTEIISKRYGKDV